MEYKKYRVKTTVKSFRDLEIYKRTTLDVPKYIAESYGDRYSERRKDRKAELG